MGVSSAEITEITTALGMVTSGLDAAFRSMPHQLRNVSPTTWVSLVEAYRAGDRRTLFEHAYANGQFFLGARDGLRGRPPLVVEWKGHHRIPGDDAIPADLRVDRVYLVSCKYLSKIVLNSGPVRLFDRGLIGDERSRIDWFLEVAPAEYQAFYEAAVDALGFAGVPDRVSALGASERQRLRDGLRSRRLPDGCRGPWRDLCAAVAHNSAVRWLEALPRRRQRLELLWRMIRVSGATYFVLGATPDASLRVRVGSKWDWLQEFELLDLRVDPRPSGQPEVGWEGVVRRRSDASPVSVNGHVEIRWSHGRFKGLPEAKVYLDTPHDSVPGYFRIADDSRELTLL